jgi:hypothetical protein
VAFTVFLKIKCHGPKTSQKLSFQCVDLFQARGRVQWALAQCCQVKRMGTCIQCWALDSQVQAENLVGLSVSLAHAVTHLPSCSNHNIVNKRS